MRCKYKPMKKIGVIKQTKPNTFWGLTLTLYLIELENSDHYLFLKTLGIDLEMVQVWS